MDSYFCSASRLSSFAAAQTNIFDSLEASFFMLQFNYGYVGISAALVFACFEYYYFHLIGDFEYCFAWIERRLGACFGNFHTFTHFWKLLYWLNLVSFKCDDHSNRHDFKNVIYFINFQLLQACWCSIFDWIRKLLFFCCLFHAE